ncbi:MAG TPA: 16S rRNA (guanine(966)-N(2))-methyltransferase RsmD [Flavobacteriaceae bacterium]|nr:16S rRNA (guanine(966)-N(2))-methyltransferase RsmD [Flavobacteriaceae bacterium]
MRIISGKYKGKRLTAPKKLPVRPTTDMAKEALFNILENHYSFSEISVFDLFSGTGNIAYEFISRGAQQITVVDANFHCIRFISKTLKDWEENIDVIKSDAFKFLSKTQKTADIIFADPPYNLPIADFEKIINLVFGKNLLNPDGILILEHSTRTTFSDLSVFTEKRKYGNSTFSFFKKN